MRITFLTHFPGKGGSTTVLIQLADFLRSRGHQISVVCGADDPNPIISDYKVVPAAYPFTRRRELYLDVVCATRPDLVYAISGTEEFDVLRFLEFPRAHHISSLETHLRTDIKRLVRKTAQYTELFSANTPDVLEDLRCLAGNAPKFHLAPYLFEEKWVQDLPSKEASTGAIQICFAGRLERFQKRAHWLPEIIAKLKEATSTTFKFHILGDGPEYQPLRVKLESHRDLVEFHGWASTAKMKQIMGASDIFFLCSKWEGLPIAMVEAMLRGLPCVVPAGPGGMEYFVKTSGGGWTYAANSPEKACQALRLAIADRSLLMKAGQAARDFSQSFFSPERVKASLEALEKSLIDLHWNGNRMKAARTSRLRAVSAYTGAIRRLSIFGSKVCGYRYRE